MEIKADNVSAIRAYAFDYIVGVLWLGALIVIAMSGNRNPQILETSNRWVEALSRFHAPDFVVGFLLTLGGVVLPYCVAVILKPATLNTMGFLQRRHRDLRRWSTRHSKSRPPETGTSLENLAKARVYGKLQCRQSDLKGTDMLVTYVQCCNALIAPQIVASRDEIYFRAMAVFPSALLVTSTISALAPAVGAPVIVLIFVALVFFGSWMSNRVFDSWLQTVYVAILLETSSSSKDQANIALHQTATDPT